MAGYICVKCKKEFDIEDKIRCPFCGSRIIAKTRPKFKKTVISR